jgi:hypothetical protein
VPAHREPCCDIGRFRYRALNIVVAIALDQKIHTLGLQFGHAGPMQEGMAEQLGAR